MHMCAIDAKLTPRTQQHQRQPSSSLTFRFNQQIAADLVNLELLKFNSKKVFGYTTQNFCVFVYKNKYTLHFVNFKLKAV